MESYSTTSICKEIVNDRHLYFYNILYSGYNKIYSVDLSLYSIFIYLANCYCWSIAKYPHLYDTKYLPKIKEYGFDNLNKLYIFEELTDVIDTVQGNEMDLELLIAPGKKIYTSSFSTF